MELLISLVSLLDFITLHPNVYKYPECGFQEVHNYSVSDFPLESENNVLSRWKAMMTMLIADNSDTKCIFTVGGQGEDRICPYHIGDHKCHDTFLIHLSVVLMMVIVVKMMLEMTNKKLVLDVFVINQIWLVSNKKYFD